MVTDYLSKGVFIHTYTKKNILLNKLLSINLLFNHSLLNLYLLPNSLEPLSISSYYYYLLIQVSTFEYLIYD